MSIQSPIIENWEREGLEWRYVFPSPMTRPFIVPANGAIQIPSADFVYNYPEGILFVFAASFDHPSCGLKADWGPNFDTGEVFTINNISLLADSDPYIYAMFPPKTPAGVYVLRMCSSWKWIENLRLFVINTGSEPHYCLGYGYILAVLIHPRKVPALEE